MGHFPHQNREASQDWPPRIISSHTGKDRTQGFLNTKPESPSFDERFNLSQNLGGAFEVTEKRGIEKSFSR